MRPAGRGGEHPAAGSTRGRDPAQPARRLDGPLQPVSRFGPHQRAPQLGLAIRPHGGNQAGATPAEEVVEEQHVRDQPNRRPSSHGHRLERPAVGRQGPGAHACGPEHQPAAVGRPSGEREELPGAPEHNRARAGARIDHVELPGGQCGPAAGAVHRDRVAASESRSGLPLPSPMVPSAAARILRRPSGAAATSWPRSVIPYSSSPRGAHDHASTPPPSGMRAAPPCEGITTGKGGPPPPSRPKASHRPSGLPTLRGRPAVAAAAPSNHRRRHPRRRGPPPTTTTAVLSAARARHSIAGANRIVTSATLTDVLRHPQPLKTPTNRPIFRGDGCDSEGCAALDRRRRLASVAHGADRRRGDRCHGARGRDGAPGCAEAPPCPGAGRACARRRPSHRRGPLAGAREPQGRR